MVVFLLKDKAHLTPPKGGFEEIKRFSGWNEYRKKILKMTLDDLTYIVIYLLDYLTKNVAVD